MLRLPDDGTGALPLLRHLILSDAKSSTYKLALLRAIARIADGTPGVAREAGDDHVAIPLGLVALTWLRLFKPLIDAGLPQSPANRGLRPSASPVLVSGRPASWRRRICALVWQHRPSCTRPKELRDNRAHAGHLYAIPTVGRSSGPSAAAASGSRRR